jgi:hypothetical protein
MGLVSGIVSSADYFLISFFAVIGLVKTLRGSTEMVDILAN